jgi:hypothetical protein
MRLNRDKRYQIEVLLEIGIFQKDIARTLGISPGGLSKEISRNGGAKRYDPEKAERRATKLSKKSHVHLKFGDEIWRERRLRASRRFIATSKGIPGLGSISGTTTRSTAGGLPPRTDAVP